MPFLECEFPRSIGYVSTGGAAFSTQVNLGFSGVEQRNRNWSKGRHSFQIPLNGKTFAYFELIRDFFLNVGGKADAFRFFWPLDSSISGQVPIGLVNSSNKIFQLRKTYSAGGRSYDYVIKKPIMSTVTRFDGTFLTDTVKVRDNGSLLTLTTDYSVDATTGIITFVTAPTTGHTITTDCDFHIPVRFDNDSMADVQILSPDKSVKWPNILLVEDRRP